MSSGVRSYGNTGPLTQAKLNAAALLASVLFGPPPTVSASSISPANAKHRPSERKLKPMRLGSAGSKKRPATSGSISRSRPQSPAAIGQVSLPLDGVRGSGSGGSPKDVNNFKDQALTRTVASPAIQKIMNRPLKTPATLLKAGHTKHKRVPSATPSTSQSSDGV